MNTTRFIGRLSSLAAALVFSFGAATVRADVPDSSSTGLRGMYKVSASTDPIFPMQANQEWFLDFGTGITSGKMSGTLAVSLRQNPNVRVRIMAWQYFPKQGVIVIGNPYSEGSTKAVAKGSWEMSGGETGINWGRGPYRMVLTKAAPGDY